MATIVFTLEDGSTITSPLDVDLITVGRAEDSIVPLPSPSVSGQHAILKARSDGYYVQDLGSRNGTRVNGATIEESILNDGDRVSFGDVEAIFYASDEVPAEAPPVAAIPTPQVVVPVVQAAPPVTGVPRGSANPQGNRAPSKRYVQESNGCLSAILVTLLFGGAFVIGLSLRHYKETNGGVLPNDFIARFMKNVKIEINEEKK